MNLRYPKSKEEREREALEREFHEANGEATMLSLKILSKDFVMNASLQEMQQAKKEHNEWVKKARQAQGKLSKQGGLK